MLNLHDTWAAVRLLEDLIEADFGWCEGWEYSIKWSDKRNGSQAELGL